MGRLTFAAQRVHQNTANFLRSESQSSFKRADDLGAAPAWFNVIAVNPPPQIRVRRLPVQHRRIPNKDKYRKQSRMFMPQKIGYEEDTLRENFFRDHPWELARPTVVLETDGRDHQSSDWSRLEQPKQPLNGESVVQRQRWIYVNEPQVTKSQAYDEARKEFYFSRHQQEVESWVAQEEALSTGACFGVSALEIGMKMENAAFENWRRRAVGEATTRKLVRESFYSSTDEDQSNDQENDSALVSRV